jgi:hypothetical protein
MRLLLQFLSISDRYELKARLLPGLLLAVVPALTLGVVLQAFTEWYSAVGAALAAEALAAIVLGHLARARGKRAEEQLWKSWGGAPTTRWLRPWDHTCSDQQKSKWRGAIKRITGLSIPASVPAGGSQDDVERQINEAMRQLRYSVRNAPEAGMVTTHNEEYGFARNLYGVRWHWLVLSVLCLAGCGALFAFGLRPYAGIAVAGVSVVVTLLIGRELPDYVRRCADRYAESLFAAAMMITQRMAESETPAKEAKTV